MKLIFEMFRKPIYGCLHHTYQSANVGLQTLNAGHAVLMPVLPAPHSVNLAVGGYASR